MKYWCEAVQGGESVEITADEFEKLRAAWDSVGSFLGIEEKFNLVLDNYAEFETELHRITLDSIIHSGWPWTTVQSDLHAVNRRLANLLMVARLYLDQGCHDISRLYGRESAAFSRWRAVTRQQYDTKLGYRVMYALRNYTQHAGLPIDSLSVGSESDGTGTSPCSFKQKIQAFVHVDDLEREKKVSRQVVAEMRLLGQDVPVIRFVRDFVAGLAAVQRAFRTEVQGDRERHVQRLRGALTRCGGGGSLRAARAFERGDDGSRLGQDSSVTFFADLLDKLEFLIRRNDSLETLPRRHLSSEA